MSLPVDRSVPKSAYLGFSPLMDPTLSRRGVTSAPLTGAREGRCDPVEYTCDLEKSLPQP